MNPTCALVSTLVGDVYCAMNEPSSTSDYAANTARSFLTNCAIVFPPRVANDYLKLWRLLCSMCVNSLQSIGLNVQYQNMIPIGELLRVMGNLTSRYRIGMGVLQNMSVNMQENVSTSGYAEVDLASVSRLPFGFTNTPSLNNQRPIFHGGQTYSFDLNGENRDLVIPHDVVSAEFRWYTSSAIYSSDVGGAITVLQNNDASVRRAGIPVEGLVWVVVAAGDGIRFSSVNGLRCMITFEFRRVIKFIGARVSPTSEEVTTMSYITGLGVDNDPEVQLFLNAMLGGRTVDSRFRSLQTGVRKVWLPLLRDMMVLGALFNFN